MQGGRGGGRRGSAIGASAKKCDNMILFCYTGYVMFSVWMREPDVVVIHDGVRPFVPEETLTDVVNAANEFGVSRHNSSTFCISSLLLCCLVNIFSDGLGN